MEVEEEFESALEEIEGVRGPRHGADRMFPFFWREGRRRGGPTRTAGILGFQRDD